MYICIMEKEIWKDIIGFDQYMVSSLGRVLSKERTRLRKDGTVGYKSQIIMKCRDQGDGYRQITLRKDNACHQKLVHRLMAETFYPEKFSTDTKISVDHINGVKDDNRLKNLEIVTHRENILRFTSSNKKSGLPRGVTKCRSKFVARARVNGKHICIGSYATPEQASAAYDEFIKNISLPYETK